MERASPGSPVDRMKRKAERPTANAPAVPPTISAPAANCVNGWRLWKNPHHGRPVPSWKRCRAGRAPASGARQILVTGRAPCRMSRLRELASAPEARSKLFSDKVLHNLHYRTLPRSGRGVTRRPIPSRMPLGSPPPTPAGPLDRQMLRRQSRQRRPRHSPSAHGPMASQLSVLPDSPQHSPRGVFSWRSMPWRCSSMLLIRRTGLRSLDRRNTPVT